MADDDWNNSPSSDALQTAIRGRINILFKDLGYNLENFDDRIRLRRNLDWADGAAQRSRELLENHEFLTALRKSDDFEENMKFVTKLRKGLGTGKARVFMILLNTAALAGILWFFSAVADSVKNWLVGAGS